MLILFLRVNGLHLYLLCSQRNTSDKINVKKLCVLKRIWSSLWNLPHINFNYLILFFLTKLPFVAHDECWGVFTWENSHQHEFHTGMTFWFRIAFTWWLGHVISCYLTIHFMLIKYTFGSKSQTLRMRYPFQSTGRLISHQNGWSFRVYMIPLRDFVPKWNSRYGARTGVDSRRGDWRGHNILWWYHVN